jgi:hypothetical protein
VACGSSTANVTETESTEPALTNSEIQQMYSDPNQFKGREVELVGLVFATVERDSDGVYFQMYQDIDNSDNNTIVAYYDPEFEISDGNYIKLTGKVDGEFKGENAFGGEITAPKLIADKVEIINYKDAVVPTIKEIPVNQTIDQHGYKVTIEKIELAEAETRVYLTVTNSGLSKFSLYSFYAKLLQDSTQYDEQLNFNAEYPEIQTDLTVGMETKGVICFPSINMDKGFSLVFEGSSEDYNEEFEPYQFDIK